MQAVILERELRGKERFEKNRRFEEKTDIAERLSYPIDIEIPYEMRGGRAYALTDTKDRAFREQTRAALEIGRFEHTGDEAFQVTRLELEHQEAVLVDAFGRGELPGNVLIKFSKVPDAVVRGETGIDGYRRDILRSFVRIYYRQGDRVNCRLFTLDNNNAAGLKAVGDLIDIDTLRQSEEVLATHTLMDIPETELDDFVDSLAERTKLVYDDALYQDTGEHTYAGSQFAGAGDAMAAVDSQPQLFDEHWNEISKIMALRLEKFDEKLQLKNLRRQTAAAISLASKGEMVQSINDANVRSEAESGNYDGDCPGAKNGMNQAALTETQVIACKQCPICGKANVIATIEGDIISGDCGCMKEICSGKLLRKGRTLEGQPIMWTPKAKENAPRLGKEALARARYGQHVRVSNEIAVGSAYTAVYDRRTGELIDTL